MNFTQEIETRKVPLWRRFLPSLRRREVSRESAPSQNRFFNNILKLRQLIETPQPKHPYYYTTGNGQVQAAQLVRQFPQAKTGIFVYRLKTNGELDYMQISMKMGNGPLDMMKFAFYIDKSGNYIDIHASRVDFGMTTTRPEELGIDDMVLRYQAPSPSKNVNWSNDRDAEAFMLQFNNGLDIVLNERSYFESPEATRVLCLSGGVTSEQ